MFYFYACIFQPNCNLKRGLERLCISIMNEHIHTVNTVVYDFMSLMHIICIGSEMYMRHLVNISTNHLFHKGLSGQPISYSFTIAKEV